MKNFYKKYKVQVILAGYILFLGVFIYGGIFTMIKNIQGRADEIQKKIIDNEIDKKNLAKIPQLMSDYEIFSAGRSNLNVILKKELEIEFIQSLENLARETGNEISLKLIEEENSSVKDSQAKTEAKEKDKLDIKSNLPYEKYITIQLELKGKYPQLMGFLEKIENMEYYANVVAFDLKKEEKSEETKTSNPFVSSGSVAAPEETPPEEILKSLIDLVVYIK